MSESKNPSVLVTDWGTVESLPPLLKKVTLELVRLGKIRIDNTPPGDISPLEPDRRHRR